MKSCIIYHVSCTSLPITIGPIHGFHVFPITYTLGWDDGTSPTLEVEGMAFDYYAKCGKVPSCLGTPISQFPLPHP
jgi:hypothetical protein